jgi:hypothetical protein
MTGALDPQLTIEYLNLLSSDIAAVAVLDAKGELLAGEPVGDGPGMRVSASSGGRTIVARLGRQAQLGLFEHDLNIAIRAMD